MAKARTRADEKIFKERDEFVRTQPSLQQSYLRFLQDLNKYREIRQIQEKRQKTKQELADYLIFGASFER